MLRNLFWRVQLLCLLCVWSVVVLSAPTAAPTKPAVTAASGSLTLKWDAPTTLIDNKTAISGAITYNLYGALQGQPKVLLAGGLTGLSSVRTGTAGTYCYVVTAVLATVESAQSGEVCGTIAGTVTPPPPPPQLVTTDTTVYMELQVKDGFSFLAVGTVSLGTPCDPTQRVNNYFVVPASTVTWTGKIQRLAALAACSSP